MTELLEKALEAARTMPTAMQDELARIIFELARQPAVIVLDPDEQRSFDESFAQAERGELATDDEVRAIWAKHGL